MAMVGKAPGSRGFAARRWLVTGLLALFTLYTLIPLIYVILASTKDEQDLFSTFGFWFGERFSLIDNICSLFTYQGGIYWTWMWNTIWYSVVSAIGAGFTSAAAGYAFSKFNFVGKGFWFAALLGSVMVPSTALVIPLFLMMTEVGLVNTPWAVILPHLVFPLGVYLMRIFADEGVPNELLEAARLDGANEFYIFFAVGLRLMGPGLVTVLLLAFTSSWNNFFLPLVVLNSTQYFPLTVGLAGWYETANQATTGASLYSVVMVGALVSIIPIILAFLLLQRFWRGGITMGSVK